MTDIYIRGTSMTRFGRHLDRSMKDLGAEAVGSVLDNAQMAVGDIESMFFSNSLAGLITGQECIRGEVVAYPLGFGSIPIHNVENACASGGNALHLACMAVRAGMHDTVLALGVEKANHEDKARTFSAYKAGTDVEQMFDTGDGAGTDRTPLVDRQAVLAQALFDGAGMTRRGLASIAAKAYAYARLNPSAHRQLDVDVDDVLAARLVVDPITSLMSSPISDGAAAVIVSRHPGPGVNIRIAGSTLASRPPKGTDGPSSAALATSQAYEMAGVSPSEVDIAEVHDASAAYEAMAWTACGLCEPGDEERWAIEGHTALGGKLPVNPSGGLIARGHALGASGLAQIHELTLQLRGEAGERQADDPRVALAQVGGGVIDWETAVSTAHVLVSDS
ncbi:MAG: thiolase family protein [Ilumatobacteraceae bacterium]|nr:thiolase family protein [Ilumatobacteraceae bacterium]